MGARIATIASDVYKVFDHFASFFLHQAKVTCGAE
jgi:hypothetical protein